MRTIGCFMYSTVRTGDSTLVTLELSGWRKGLQTVSLIDAIREHGGTSSDNAKRIVSIVRI